MSRPGRHRDGAGQQHEIVVPGAAVVRHDELIMQPEEMEAQPSEKLGREHIAKPQQAHGLQRDPSARAPIPSTGSKSQKFMMSARDWQSIQRTDGSLASRAAMARRRPALGCSAAPGAM